MTRGDLNSLAAAIPQVFKVQGGVDFKVRGRLRTRLRGQTLRVPAGRGSKTWTKSGRFDGGVFLDERLGFFQSGDHANHGINLRYLEEFHDAGAYTNDNQPAALILAVDMIIDDHTHACRIHVGHFCQVKDCDRRGLGSAQLRLKVEDVDECEGSGKANNQRARGFAFFTFYLQRSVDGHIEKSIKKKEASVDEYSVNVTGVTDGRY